MKTQYRFNEYYCGDSYLDIDVYPEFCKPKGKRKKNKYKPSREAQEILNRSNRDKYIIRLFNHNYNKDSFYVTLTYDDEHLPETYEIAERNLRNYIRRVKALAKKKGLFILIFAVTGYGSRRKRLHHHLMIHCPGLSAFELRDLWKDRRGARGVMRGLTHIDPAEPDIKLGLEQLARYFMKHIDENRKRGLKTTYYRSRNHKEPEFKPRQMRLKKIEILHMAEHFDFSAIENLYPGYSLIRSEHYPTEKERASAIVFNEINGGYYFHFKLYRPPWIKNKLRR